MARVPPQRGKSGDQSPAFDLPRRRGARSRNADIPSNPPRRTKVPFYAHRSADVVPAHLSHLHLTWTAARGRQAAHASGSRGMGGRLSSMSPRPHPPLARGSGRDLRPAAGGLSAFSTSPVEVMAQIDRSAYFYPVLSDLSTAWRRQSLGALHVRPIPSGALGEKDRVGHESQHAPSTGEPPCSDTLTRAP